MDFMSSYLAWLEGDSFDQSTRGELETIRKDEKEIEDRFYKNLEFGTGGLRGILGAGTNRMNIYTVRKATQGLANYLLKQSAENAAKGVAIAYDSRHMSAEFCLQAARVLNGNGIKTFTFDALRPTPVLSFAVRALGCAAGIVITASHNPKDYNGYKVYGSDGGQVPYPEDEAIINEVNAVTDFSQIKYAEQSSLFVVADQSLDDAYVQQVKAQLINPKVVKQQSDSMTIVFTPLHGAGNVPVRRVLSEIGFNKVHVVPEQEAPDPDFPTVPYPNPEDPAVFALGIKLAEQTGADLILATDPDSDRLGCAVQDKTGAWVFLTGNMIGTLIAEYVLSQKAKNGTLPSDAAVISTIVSSRLTRKIAENYGVAYFDTLTGFKYIGEKIKAFEADGSHTYLFGFEESYGYLAGTYARDKDAVGAAMLVCELAAHYKAQGLSLLDGLNAMYEKYGHYKENTESMTMKGLDGIAAINKIMASLRGNPPKTVNGTTVTGICDYRAGICKNIAAGTEAPIALPPSDVLIFEMADGCWFAARPSGTEPKIKIYFGVTADSRQAAEDKFLRISEEVMQAIIS